MVQEGPTPGGESSGRRRPGQGGRFAGSGHGGELRERQPGGHGVHRGTADLGQRLRPLDPRPLRGAASPGSGGFGAVYLGHDGQLDRPVAIKVLHAGAGQRADPERSRQEARRLAQLHHPGIVAVHDIGVHEGDVYVVSDYLEGGDLLGWMRENRRGAGLHRLRLPRRPRPRPGGCGTTARPGRRRPGSRPPWPTRWPTPTPGSSSTATSSPRTSSSPPSARRCWWTSASPSSEDQAGGGEKGVLSGTP